MVKELPTRYSHRWGRLGFYVLVILALAVSSLQQASSREPLASTYQVTAAQLLALEQLNQLVDEGEPSEVVDLLVRTMDESQGRLISVAGDDRAVGSSRFVHWVPFRLYLQDRLLRWGIARREILDEYRSRADRLAKERLERVRNARDLDQARELVDEIYPTSFGDDALLLVADLAIEQGAFWTAIDALRRIDPRWQATSFGEAGELVSALGWESVLPRFDTDSKTELIRRFRFGEPWQRGWSLGSYVDSDLDQADVGLRLAIAYQLAGQHEVSLWIAECLKTWFGDSKVWWQGTQVGIKDALDEIVVALSNARVQKIASQSRDPNWSTLGHDSNRVYRTASLPTVDAIPAWRVELPEIEIDDSARPSVRPIGSGDGPEMASDLMRPVRSIPIVAGGIVIRQWGNGLYANRLEDGKTWPDVSNEGAFFEDTISDRLKPSTGLMESVGQIWWTLSATRGRVAGRFGPPESGWLTHLKPDRSLSRIELVDLRRDGRLVDRYPALVDSLAPLSTWELEGAPLILGDRLYVGLSRRDEATLTSAVGCLDLASGQWLFVSPSIASARLLGHEQANRYGQSVVSYRDGIVFYQCDSGIVAAVDGASGSIRWSVQYRRSELAESAYPHDSRAEQRQASPVAIVDGQAVVMAADQDGSFAVDVATGRLIWASEPGLLGDVDQVLGTVDGRLLMGGDSLYWVEPSSGRIEASWPAGTSAQVHGALPQPRRAGRGLLAGTDIYWPTEEAIWVFDGHLREHEFVGIPQPKRCLDLVPWGLRGGDLIAADGTLIMASGRTTMAFRSNQESNLNREANGLGRPESRSTLDVDSNEPTEQSADEISRKP